MAQAHCVDAEQIRGSSRGSQYVSNVRHLIAYVLKFKYHLTYKHIGHLLGGRDHTTIINSVRQVNEITNPDLWQEVMQQGIKVDSLN